MGIWSPNWKNNSSYIDAVSFHSIWLWKSSILTLIALVLVAEFSLSFSRLFSDVSHFSSFCDIKSFHILTHNHNPKTTFKPRTNTSTSLKQQLNFSHQRMTATILNLQNRDPFAFQSQTEFDEDVAIVPVNETYIHIRVQQRNGKKCLTTIQGLESNLVKEICTPLKKKLCCSGTIIDDKELGMLFRISSVVTRIAHIRSLQVLFFNSLETSAKLYLNILPKRNKSKKNYSKSMAINQQTDSSNSASSTTNKTIMTTITTTTTQILTMYLTSPYTTCNTPILTDCDTIKNYENPNCLVFLFWN